jgi:hypothetical protein
MTTHMTGTRKDWLAARLELLEAEKELTRHSDELSRRRQELPWVRMGVVRIGAALQNVGAKVDFEVLSLPGGSLIAVLLWLYASAMGSIRRAATQVRPSRATIDARSVAADRSIASERLTPPIRACVGCPATGRSYV